MIPYRFVEPIVTERLTLRLMTEADVDDVHAYQSRPDVAEYMLYEPRTRDEVAEKVARNAVADTLENDGDFVQLALDLNGRVIGEVYFTITKAEQSGAEIGWSLHPDFAGKGYASEAAHAVLDLGFGTLRLHRVIAELDPRNAASVALCKRLGMRKEAHFVEDLDFKGAWADTGIYAILDREWNAR